MKTRIWALASALALTSFTAGVEAADLRGGTPYVVVDNWSGFYFGATVGYADASVTVSASVPGLGGISASGDGGHFAGGFMAGYNWQRGNQVYGLEADIALPSDLDYLASIRGRYGFINDNWLLYGTAGVAFISSGGSVSGMGIHYDGYSAPGFVIGAGAETKITPRLTAGIEGLYYIFAEDSQDIGYGINIKTSVDVFSIRGRLTYQLDSAYAGLK
jgi:outer membrane immunogenic protein